MVSSLALLAVLVMKNFDACLDSPEFLNLLQHRFAPPAASPGPSKPKPLEEPATKRPKTGPQNLKGASKGNFMRVPSELLALGCVGATTKGHRLCFDYNLKRCKLSVKDQRCGKGLHLWRSQGLSEDAHGG